MVEEEISPSQHMNMDPWIYNIMINITIGKFMMMTRMLREIDNHARFIGPY